MLKRHRDDNVALSWRVLGALDLEIGAQKPLITIAAMLAMVYCRVYQVYHIIVIYPLSWTPILDGLWTWVYHGFYHGLPHSCGIPWYTQCHKAYSLVIQLRSDSCSDSTWEDCSLTMGQVICGTQGPRGPGDSRWWCVFMLIWRENMAVCQNLVSL